MANSCDWIELMTYFGSGDIQKGLDKAGSKLKANGMTYWKSPNVEAYNTSGLSVLPAGCRINTGFIWMGEKSSIISSDLCGINTILAVSSYYNHSRSDFGAGGMEMGLSVRCVKNKSVTVLIK